MTMQPTNRMRWVRRPYRTPGLQQLWVPNDNPYPGQTIDVATAELAGCEWRDIPVEEGE